MKGLELSRRYYLEYGKPMLESGFAELIPLIAVGLVGSGSECFGYDDDISADHDFEPGFCILLPDESKLDRKAEFALERAYAKLPKEFLGYRRSLLAPVGKRHGVIRMEDFFKEKTGKWDGILSLSDWLTIPEQSLLEATSGEVFFDGLGIFSDVRKRLAYFPEDVRLKKLSGHLLLMAQSGQYNYQRCAARKETAAAQLALNEFVTSALHVIFLLNKHYLPYYKWSFRALKEQTILSELYEDLEFLISNPNTDDLIQKKLSLIERIACDIRKELICQSITDYNESELEGHAYSVNSHIIDPNVRNLHILYAV